MSTFGETGNTAVRAVEYTCRDCGHTHIYEPNQPEHLQIQQDKGEVTCPTCGGQAAFKTQDGTYHVILQSGAKELRTFA